MKKHNDFWAWLLLIFLVWAAMATCCDTTRTNAAPPPVEWNWVAPLEEGTTIVTITGWVQDQEGSPVIGDAYVELVQVNDAGWPVVVIERKYLVGQHSFAFERALREGRYAVLLDYADLTGWACASDDQCWRYFGIVLDQSPVAMQVVWTMRPAEEVTITPTLYQSPTPTASVTPTPTFSPTATVTQTLEATATPTPAPTFTPGPCVGLQQFTFSERWSIMATSSQYIGRVEDYLDFVDDVTLYWGFDEHLGAPLTRPFLVTGEDGSEILCRAFCQAIIASRQDADIGPHCYHYGIVDWYLYEGALEALPRGE